MKIAIVRGPLLSHSGYGVHSRQVFRWLLNKGFDVRCQVTPWGMTSWYLGRDRLNGLVGEIMDRSSPPPRKADVSFQVQLPDEWDPNLANKNVGVSAVVETDRCNPAWITACNQMDGVIVPTEFTKQVLTNTGYCQTEITVIPESFPDELIIDESIKKKNFLRTKTKRNFLLFGQLTAPDAQDDRKNTEYAIKWFCETFSDRKDVGLVIKTNMGTNSTIDRRVSFNKLSQVVKHHREGRFPKVTLLHGDLNEKTLLNLYLDKSLVGLISATRGEGFGLPMLEAAACGLPVMSTNWSGHLDFLNHGEWTKVGYEMQEISPSRADGRIFMPGSRWANPIEADFKNGLKSMLTNVSSNRKNAKILQRKIQENYSQAAVETKYNAFLDKLC